MQHQAAVNASPADYHGQGIIKRWNDHQVTIAHQAIPALHWLPMTMTFTLPDSLTAQTLAVGTPVDFSFRQQDRGYTLTAIETIKP